MTTRTKLEIEHQVLEVVRAVESNRPVEDAIVELKQDWPLDLFKMARRLAGHANAARGAPILWIIGVDEKGGCVAGAHARDAATWYPKLASHFDGPAPELFDLAVHLNTLTLMALSFETDRAPYVVKPPPPASGTHYQYEVPWREGTAVRTARRNDLIRLLVPLSRTPSCDVLSAEMSHVKMGDSMMCRLQVEVFLRPMTPDPVCIPFRDIELRATWGSVSRQFDLWRRLGHVSLFEGKAYTGFEMSLALRIGVREALVTAPGTAILYGQVALENTCGEELSDKDMVVRFKLPVVGAPPIVVQTTLPPSTIPRATPGSVGLWRR